MLIWIAKFPDFQIYIFFKPLLRDEELAKKDSISLFMIKYTIFGIIWEQILREEFLFFGHTMRLRILVPRLGPAVEAQYPKHWPAKFKREGFKALGHWWSEILRALSWQKVLTFEPEKSSVQSSPKYPGPQPKDLMKNTEGNVTPLEIQRNITWVTFLGPNFKNTSIHFVPSSADRTLSMW